MDSKLICTDGIARFSKNQGFGNRTVCFLCLYRASNMCFVSSFVSTGMNSQSLAGWQLFPWEYHICKKTFEKSCLLFVKARTRRHQNFFLLTNDKESNPKLTTKTTRTHTRWRKTAFGHWTHPGKRSHISPTHCLCC